MNFDLYLEQELPQDEIILFISWDSKYSRTYLYLNSNNPNFETKNTNKQKILDYFKISEKLLKRRISSWLFISVIELF